VKAQIQNSSEHLEINMQIWQHYIVIVLLFMKQEGHEPASSNKLLAHYIGGRTQRPAAVVDRPHVRQVSSAFNFSQGLHDRGG
jgi:hypothetical protein